MPDLPDLRAGIWRHYTGHLYLVLGYAHDSTNSLADENRTVVVYVGLDLDGAKSGTRMLVREVGEFFEGVDPATGEPAVCWSGTGFRPVPRFMYVGPTVDLTGGMR